VRGPTFIIITAGGKKAYCSEGSQAVPARPSGKGRLVTGKGLRSAEGKVIGSGLYTVHTVHFHLITHFLTNKMHTLCYAIQLVDTIKLIQHVSVLQWHHYQGFKP
jgi:hypothetical protein